MKTQSQGAFAPDVVHPVLPCRRLASNVLALHADVRPPVVQSRRRGRLPAGVTRLFRSDRPKIYVGVVCLLRAPGNDDIPVRVFQVMEDGRYGIVALTDRLITIPDAGVVSEVAVACERVLMRTATLRGLYA